MKMTNHTTTQAIKPNIVKDAMVGLMTSVGVGIIASVIFALVILFLSSNALANVPDNQYLSCDLQAVQVHQGIPLFSTRDKGDVLVALSKADTDYFSNLRKELFPVNQVNSSRPNILTAHLIGQGHTIAVVAQLDAS